MSLRNLGFTERKVELRELTIAELKLEIIKSYVDKGVIEVQLIDITSGDTTTFNTIEDVTRNEWSGNCKIELINLPHSYGTEEKRKVLMIFQEIEDDNRVIE